MKHFIFIVVYQNRIESLHRAIVDRGVSRTAREFLQDPCRSCTFSLTFHRLRRLIWMEEPIKSLGKNDFAQECPTHGRARGYSGERESAPDSASGENGSPEEVRARVRGWPLARVSTRVYVCAARAHVDARGPGRGPARCVRVCGCARLRACSYARAEGPVALAEEPEARAWAFHSCHPHRSLTIVPTGGVRPCVGGTRPCARGSVSTIAHLDLAHFAAIGGRSGTRVRSLAVPRLVSRAPRLRSENFQCPPELKKN